LTVVVYLLHDSSLENDIDSILIANCACHDWIASNQ
jgi:hypothetical protein